MELLNLSTMISVRILVLLILSIGIMPIKSFAADNENSEVSTNRDPASSLETKKNIADQMTTDNEEEPTRIFKGDWRKSLSDSGFSFDAFYFWNGISNMSGGTRKGSIGSSTFDAFLYFDFDKIMGWSGGTFLIQYHNNTVDNIQSYVGDFMGVNAYTMATSESLISQAYLKQEWGTSGLDSLIGLYDFSSEFFVTESSFIFFNNGYQFGGEAYPPAPAVLSMYPINGPALRLKWANENFGYILAGVGSATARDPNFNTGTHPRMGKDEGYYSIVEAALQNEYEKNVYNKIALGAWSLSNDFDKLDGSGEKDKGKGIYVLIDFHIARQLSGFARYGKSNELVSSVDESVSFGLNFSGLFTEKDQLGFGYAQSNLSKIDRNTRQQAGENLVSSESALELVYRIEPIDGFTIMPDLQKITNPSMNKAIKEATVASVRLELSF